MCVTVDCRSLSLLASPEPIQFYTTFLFILVSFDAAYFIFTGTIFQTNRYDFTATQSTRVRIKFISLSPPSLYATLPPILWDVKLYARFRVLQSVTLLALGIKESIRESTPKSEMHRKEKCAYAYIPITSSVLL